MKIALNGASGFVGGHIKNRFQDHVIIEKTDSEAMILEKLKDVDVAINLAGAPIIKKWDEDYKQLLIESRIESTRKLVNALNQSACSQFISASAIGIYPNDVACDETTHSYAEDFLAQLVQRWEEEAQTCHKPTAILRFGVVLGNDGGALKQMLPAFKMGLGGIIGYGKMMTSWIDIDDLINIYTFIIENKLSGIFNATAPHPISNYELTKTLGKVLFRPTLLPLPESFLTLMFGEAASVMIDSKEVYPKNLQAQGFEFSYPNIETSLRHLLKKQ
ncbi:TIGR01777 family oxidoreductase [Sulfurospirillum sp. 1612]|uniref:TIGR01777 family oxidoreductase n=1 Tax=Sulfurospirillum sp. 1612 TaxID=3094835 RepID=UPI002F9470AE